MSTPQKDTKKVPPPVSAGLPQFNRVGRDDGTDTILKPQIDPAVKRRTLAIVVVAAVLLILLVLVSRTRLGVTTTGGGEGRGGVPFDPPARGSFK